MKKILIYLFSVALLFGVGIALSSYASNGKQKSHWSRVIHDRSELEIVVQLTSIPHLPLPNGIVINASTGEMETGSINGTDVVVNCQVDDIIAVQFPENVNLIKTPVTAADMTAGIKYIYVTPL